MSAYLLDVTSSRNRNTHKKNKIKKVGKKRSCGATCQNYCFTYVTFRKMAKRLRNIKKEIPPPPKKCVKVFLWCENQKADIIPQSHSIDSNILTFTLNVKVKSILKNKKIDYRIESDDVQMVPKKKKEKHGETDRGKDRMEKDSWARVWICRAWPTPMAKALLKANPTFSKHFTMFSFSMWKEEDENDNGVNRFSFLLLFSSRNPWGH